MALLFMSSQAMLNLMRIICRKEFLDRLVLEGKDNIIEEELFYYKSQQRYTGSYEISFQNTFMEEHKLVFKMEIRKLLKLLESSIQNYAFNYNFQNQIYQGKWEDVVAMPGNGLTMEQIRQLQEEEKINQFLNHVCSNCHYTIAIGLIKVAYQVLVQYNKVRSEDPVCEDLLEIAKKISKNIRCYGLDPYSFPSSDVRMSNELFSRYADFMNIYCSTVMLVLALYFENPYTNKEDSADSLKRQLARPCMEENSEEEIFEVNPQKRRKFSF